MTLGFLACQQGDAIAHPRQPHHAAEVGGVHLLAHAEPLSVHQRAQHSVREGDAGYLVCDAVEVVGCAVVRACPPERPGTGLAGESEGRFAGVRAFRPVTGGGAIDDLRVVFL